MDKNKLPLKISLFRDKIIREYYGEDLLNMTELASMFKMSRQSVHVILTKQPRKYEKNVKICKV